MSRCIDNTKDEDEDEGEAPSVGGALFRIPSLGMGFALSLAVGAAPTGLGFYLEWESVCFKEFIQAGVFGFNREYVAPKRNSGNGRIEVLGENPQQRHEAQFFLMLKCASALTRKERQPARRPSVPRAK